MLQGVLQLLSSRMPLRYRIVLQANPGNMVVNAMRVQVNHQSAYLVKTCAPTTMSVQRPIF